MDEILKAQLPYTLRQADFPALGELYRGKVRDNYSKGDRIVMITTDRLSAFDRVLTTIPFKGEILKARGSAAFPEAPPEPQADERLLSLLRDRARALLLASGFLNPQQPDLVLDELVSLLRRARPARREVELLLAAIAQLERTRR